MEVTLKINFGDALSASELRELTRIASVRGVSVEEIVADALRAEVDRLRGKEGQNNEG
jgi:hypothetical protein